MNISSGVKILCCLTVLGLMWHQDSAESNAVALHSDYDDFEEYGDDSGDAWTHASYNPFIEQRRLKRSKGGSESDYRTYGSRSGSDSICEKDCENAGILIIIFCVIGCCGCSIGIQICKKMRETSEQEKRQKQLREKLYPEANLDCETEAFILPNGDINPNIYRNGLDSMKNDNVVLTSDLTALESTNREPFSYDNKMAGPPKVANSVLTAPIGVQYNFQQPGAAHMMVPGE